MNDRGNQGDLGDRGDMRKRGDLGNLATVVLERPWRLVQ
jgi:hypothetical protein